MSQAWVTLATNDTYALGCLVLGRSLRRVQTEKKLHCMVTPGVSQQMRSILARVYDTIEQVDLMNSGDSENLNLMDRPDLGVTFTKLHCWRLTQYEKCVFLDADCMLLQNSDELFDHPEISAAADIGWPDCFNSGVFVFKPSLDTWQQLINTAMRIGSFDGGDQGVLNAFFSDWRELDVAHRLSFVYNMSSSVTYTYAPAHKRFSGQIKIVHFLGAIKPWMHSTARGEFFYKGESRHSIGHVEMWWRIYTQDIKPLLNADDTTTIQARGTAPVLTHSNGKSKDKSDVERQRDWEEGRIDYTGQDSFANIQKHLEQNLKPTGTKQ